MEKLIGELEAVLADNLSTIEQKQRRMGENGVSGKLEKEERAGVFQLVGFAGGDGQKFCKIVGFCVDYGV